MKRFRLTQTIAMLITGCACGGMLLLSTDATAFNLWSTKSSYLATGQFFGPGTNTAEQPLFSMVARNMAFVTSADLITPFVNNGPGEPNICAQKETGASRASGRLSNGLLINENIDMCSMMIGSTRILPAVVRDGEQGGQQIFMTLQDGNMVLTSDLGLEVIGKKKGIVRLPLYATTGSVTVPLSLQTQGGAVGGGVDQAGIYPSGTVLTGRIGDFNGDGWIDGTLVAIGVMPLDSPIFPGQPFAFYRHFEMDVPIDGMMAGNVKALNIKHSKK